MKQYTSECRTRPLLTLNVVGYVYHHWWQPTESFLESRKYVIVEDSIGGGKSGLTHLTGQHHFKTALLPAGTNMPYTFDYSLFRSVQSIV